MGAGGAQHVFFYRLTAGGVFTCGFKISRATPIGSKANRLHFDRRDDVEGNKPPRLRS